MAVDKGAAFIKRNRPPRVQIEYKVEEYGSEKVVQLPFIMGVMADLAGKSTSAEAQKSVDQRRMTEVSARTFNEYMKNLQPRVAFSVPNKITGSDDLLVDLTFESLDDFTPGRIAEKVEALKPWIDARKQLQRLLSLMDGKAGAEKLVGQALGSQGLLDTLVQEAETADAAEASDEAAADGDKG